VATFGHLHVLRFAFGADQKSSIHSPGGPHVEALVADGRPAAEAWRPDWLGIRCGDGLVDEAI
jgi:hypothetical protein